MDSKTCATCGQDQPLSAYHVRRATRRDREGKPYLYEHTAATCKGCEHGGKKAWRKTPEAIASERQFRQTNEKRRMWAKTPTGQESIRRYRASLRNLLRQSVADFKARGGTGLVTLTLPELGELLELYQTTCAYCRKPLLRDAEVGHPSKLTLDHIIPLNRGGQHSRGNLVPACGLCNMRKNVMDLKPLPPPPLLNPPAADQPPSLSGV